MDGTGRFRMRKATRFGVLILAVISLTCFVWSKAQVNTKLANRYHQWQEQAEKDKKISKRVETYRKRFKKLELNKNKSEKELEEWWKKIEEEDRKN